MGRIRDGGITVPCSRTVALPIVSCVTASCRCLDSGLEMVCLISSSTSVQKLTVSGIVTYYLSAFLDTAGIHGQVTQMNVQLGMSAVQVVFAAAGATIVDKVGRRPMLIIVNIVCCFCWIGVIVPSSIANITDLGSEAQTNAVLPSVSKAVLAWVYIFQICYSFGWTPMQALYPVEVVSFEMRAKGMAFSSLFTQIGMLNFL